MVLNRRDGLKSKLDWRFWPSTPASPEKHNDSALLDYARHLELEDHQNIAWGLAQCEQTAEKTAVVDVLDVVGPKVTWKYHVGNDVLQEMVKVCWYSDISPYLTYSSIYDQSPFSKSVLRSCVSL